ncbi:MAG: aldehyde ferredoxin oxidoreductase family protein [Deltaproteobacteria bacterium]|nr:aldehyde ferredoxin oxidoreductase family protein [Deltaproteobacteria bacterium]MBW2121104.1 aldehyde ferredoxin oxidoreductase family protein [Deltaproteobacteria bacterium]
MDLYQGRIIRVDLSRGELTVEETRKDWIDRYIGGMGLAFRYLFDEVDPQVDPLSPENPMIFMTGPLAGTLAPLTCRTILVSKSPKSGTIFQSSVGGAVAAEIKYAGYDGIIIKGKAPKPVYLSVKDARIEIRDAGSLWGKGIYATEKALKELEGDAEIKTLSIGPAGENLVPMACIGSESYRQFGRDGTGTLMGSKNLKAIAIRGTGAVHVANMSGFLDYVREISSTDLMTERNLWAHTDGTPILVEAMNEMGIHPTRNFQEGTFEGWERISSDAVKSIKKGARACHSCPMACGNFVRTEKAMVEGPEYETLALGGSNCAVADIEAVALFNELCDDMGLDTISTGNTIAFSMEMTERGIHDFGVTFGDKENYLRIPDEMAHLQGRGRELAQGVRYLAEKFGGREFAMEIKNLELPGYDPRGNYGMGLAYATSDRGACHMPAFTVFSEKPFDLEAMAEEVVAGQNRNSIKWSMCFCDFWGSVNTRIMSRFLEYGLGKRIPPSELDRIGERIWNLSRLFNLKAGFTRADDDIPQRLKEHPLRKGAREGKVLSVDDFETMLHHYYRIRGWDSEGVPAAEKLEDLGIADLA